MADTEYSLREGQLYLTGPGLMHYQQASLEEAMDELCLHIDIEEWTANDHSAAEAIDKFELAEADDCIGKLRELPHAPAYDLHGAMKHFLEAYLACTKGAPGLYTTIKQHVVQILLKTALAYDDGGERLQLPMRDMKTYRYRLAMQYIQANYAGTVTLPGVAEKLNISPRQLQRIFKDVHGDASFSSILEEVRLAAVCRKLAETDLPVERIAVEEGFSNGNYLHSVFRKRFGITPSAYRKSHQS